MLFIAFVFLHRSIGSIVRIVIDVVIGLSILIALIKYFCYMLNSNYGSSQCVQQIKGSNISSIRTFFFWEGLSFQCANWQHSWFIPYPVTLKLLCCVPWHILKNQIYSHELLKMLAYFLFNVINFNLSINNIHFFMCCLHTLWLLSF